MKHKTKNPLYLTFPDQKLLWSSPPKERYWLVRKYIYNRDNGICAICGKHVTLDRNMHIDHIVPTKFGGQDSYDNLQITHQKCNQHKGPKYNIKTKEFYIPGEQNAKD